MAVHDDFEGLIKSVGRGSQVRRIIAYDKVHRETHGVRRIPVRFAHRRQVEYLARLVEGCRLVRDTLAEVTPPHPHVITNDDDAGAKVLADRRDRRGDYRDQTELDCHG